MGKWYELLIMNPRDYIILSMQFTTKFFTKKVIFALLLLLGPNYIFAGEKKEKEVEPFSHYISSLKSVAIDFRQSDSRGETASGRMILSKPNKFRLNYYPPYPLLILGNDYEVVVYDHSLNQTTRIDKKDNLFNFLLVDGKEWKKNFKIEEVIEHEMGSIVKLYNYATERTISLIFKTKPITLTEIIIDEPDGNVIEVMIDKISLISNPDKGLFSLPNPEVYGKPKRMGEQELGSKYRASSS